jgi:type IV pilus assembly protein PilW
MSAPTPFLRRTRHHGFSLIEVMIGVVIGLIAVLVIYQVFAAAEGIKRNTTSAGDAQQNGLLSSFMLTVELMNASNGVASAMLALDSCPATGSMDTSFRPIPILITDGGGPTAPDQFVVNYSISNSTVTPLPLKQPAAGLDYVIHSPFGVAVGDLIVGISGSGVCHPSKVTAVVPMDGLGPLDPAASGQVKVSHTGAAEAFGPDGAFVLNLGSALNPQRIRYDVDPATGVLRSTALWDANGAAVAQAPNPLASNIVNMKLQYGVDNDNNGLLDTWVNATGPWSAANMLAAPIGTLSKIKAVRLAILVRGEQWDKAQGDYNWSFFDGTVSGTILAAGGNYRYRVYETVVPVRNSIWNPHS